MHLLHVVGARPNFMKAAPVLRALAAAGSVRQTSACQTSVRQTLVHTGQHYDFNMSDVFFQQLKMPAPDVNLAVGPGSHAQQTAEIMQRLEPVILDRAPDRVVVYGDVNSTMAAALVCSKLVCSKLPVPVAHVEAGLRSGDRTMPEEINRIVTDQLADMLFTPSADGDQNLLREGISKDRIHCVGNVMIDTLVSLLPHAQPAADAPESGSYVLVTLHRPSNVDDLPWLGHLIEVLERVSGERNVVFPVHPRTRERLKQLGFSQVSRQQFCLLDPLPYLDFLALQKNAAVVVTDSGGIQEETTFLGIPCLTVRENTERPITTTLGTNKLVGRDVQRLEAEIHRAFTEPRPSSPQIPLWDGHAAERIAHILLNA